MGATTGSSSTGVSNGGWGTAATGLEGVGGGLMASGVGVVPGAILYGLGALTGAVSGSNARKHAEAIQDQSQSMQDAFHTNAMAQVGGAVNAAAGAPAAAGGETQASQGDFSKAVAGQLTSGAPAVAGANPRYAAANGRNVTANTPANTGVATYAHQVSSALAGQQGTLNAARMVQQKIADAGSNVGAMQSEAYTDGLVSNLASGDINTNPYVQLLAGVAKNAGKFIGGGGLDSAGGAAGSAFSMAGDDGMNMAGDALAAGGTDLGSSFGADAASALA